MAKWELKRVGWLRHRIRIYRNDMWVITLEPFRHSEGGAVHYCPGWCSLEYESDTELRRALEHALTTVDGSGIISP